MIKLANKIIEELENQTLTAKEAWKNLQEIKQGLSDDEYAEFSTTVGEYLWDEVNETEPELNDLILEDSTQSTDKWDNEVDGWAEEFILSHFLFDE